MTGKLRLAPQPVKRAFHVASESGAAWRAQHAADQIVAEMRGKRERVVILGSGWAGYTFAQKLDHRKYERILISPRSYFVFTPLLAGTTVGTLEFRAVAEPVRKLGLDNFHQGWADEVDFARKTVRVEGNTSDDLLTGRIMAATTRDGDGKKKDVFDVPYDKLVIAVGSYSQTFGIEGVREYANFLRELGDARKIRQKILQCFEKAALPVTTDAERKKLLHFAVVGGGPTGIEFAAELHDLIRDDLSRLYTNIMEFVEITVYDIAPKVLPMFDQTLANYAMELFKREGIRVKTEHHLQRIRPDESCEGCLKLKIKEYGDKEVGAGIVVWSTGLMQNPLVEKLGKKAFKLSATDTPSPSSTPSSEVMLQRDQRTGGIITNDHLRVQVVRRDHSSSADQTPPATSTAIALPDVFAIGDCSIVTGQSLPATAQVASQKATYLAKRLNKGDVDAKKFVFKNWGTMTYLGNWKAIHQSSADEMRGVSNP